MNTQKHLKKEHKIHLRKPGERICPVHFLQGNPCITKKESAQHTDPLNSFLMMFILC